MDLPTRFSFTPRSPPQHSQHKKPKMKKFITFLALTFVFSGCVFAQFTTPRFSTTPNGNNTGSGLTYKYSTVTFTSPYAVPSNAYETIVKMGTLTAAQTLTATVTSCHVGDKLEIIFTADTLTAGRVVTFSTGFIVSASTLTVDASQKATISFIFDGVAWIETARAKQ